MNILTTNKILKRRRTTSTMKPISPPSKSKMPPRPTRISFWFRRMKKTSTLRFLCRKRFILKGQSGMTCSAMTNNSQLWRGLGIRRAQAKTSSTCSMAKARAWNSLTKYLATTNLCKIFQIWACPKIWGRILRRVSLCHNIRKSVTANPWRNNYSRPRNPTPRWKMSIPQAIEMLLNRRKRWKWPLDTNSFKKRRKNCCSTCWKTKTPPSKRIIIKVPALFWIWQNSEIKIRSVVQVSMLRDL